MINTSLLRGIIASKGMTQTQVAKALGMTPKTFYVKMGKKVFDSDEIEAMVRILDIPLSKCGVIFFAPDVTYYVTTKDDLTA